MKFMSVCSTPHLTVTLIVAMAASGCATQAADSPDVSRNSASTTPVASLNTAAPKASATPKATWRNVTLPTGTLLHLALTSSLASDTSTVEDVVGAELTRPITVDGQEVVPAGARVSGNVTRVNDAGRVKGRGLVAFRFTTLRVGTAQYALRSETVTREAEATKSEDAAKIGVGAGAGAVIGGLLGGKKGAAQGAAVGGGAGTGVVLATKGKAMQLDAGDDVSSQLTAPLSVRVQR
jgi:hypothetical protein